MSDMDERRYTDDGRELARIELNGYEIDFPVVSLQDDEGRYNLPVLVDFFFDGDDVWDEIFADDIAEWEREHPRDEEEIRYAPLRYKGFTSTPLYEDGRFVGVIDDIDGLAEWEADEITEVEQAFHDAVDDYIDGCAEAGVPAKRSGEKGI